MKFVFNSEYSGQSEVLVFGVFEDNVLSDEAESFDASSGGLIRRAFNGSKFKGSIAKSLSVVVPAVDGVDRLLLIGLGKKDSLNAYSLERVGAAIYTSISSTAHKSCHINMASVVPKDMCAASSAARIAHGYDLRSWRFDELKTKKVDELPKGLDLLTIITSDVAAAQKCFDELSAIKQGVDFTKHLVTLPPNMLYPESMAAKLKELESLGIQVEIFAKKKLQELGMGALLGVGQGSSAEPYVVIMNWKGAASAEAPFAFIGKGVTFDSGGLNIKPTGSMEDMKYDMGGAGVVAGLMKSIALRKMPLNVVGAVGLVENMISGNAQRPSDVVKTMSGQTVEVLNTDAEGRLVLCDVLHYVKETFKPRSMVDLATLTGAIVISLGDQYAGLFSNDDDLSQKLTDAGKNVHERLWRLPMGPEYNEMLDSDIADMKNISGGRKAGSITAAEFLKRFVGDTPWAHLDIAGTAWADKSWPLCEKGASAFGVRLLHEFLRKQI